MSSTDERATLPEAVTFDPDDGGLVETTVTFGSPGIQYVRLRADASGERFVSNPVRVSETAPERRTYWGDIHLHSQYSDGTGSVERGMRFARDVMALDVVAYTDHDTMGFFIPPRWQLARMRRRYFAETKETVREFHDPGEFVTLFGYEWTQQPNVGGHINCYFDGVADAELFASLDEESGSVDRLWRRLTRWREATDGDVVTIPHHSAEAMYPFDFSDVAYDDDLAPLVEVYSQWGSSERPASAGNRKPVRMGQGEVETPGHYVQDALAMDHRVGLVASSDYHGPHPGHSLIHAKPHLPSRREWLRDGIGWGVIWRVWNEESYPGGLAAFRAPALTRSDIFDALRTRSVYGTTQPDRILVDFSVNGVAVGERDSTVVVDAVDAERVVTVSVAGTAPLQTVEVVKNNDVLRRIQVTDDRDASLEQYAMTAGIVDDDPVAGIRWDAERGTDDDVYYLRVTQVDGGAAWAGPLWVSLES